MHLLAGKKKLEDKHRDLNVLPKINKSDMAGMMEAIKEHLRFHCSVVSALLAYNIRKTIKVQNYGDYPMYANPDNEIITRMLHLPSEKGKVHNEQSAQSVTQHTTEYKINNTTVYDILD